MQISSITKEVSEALDLLQKQEKAYVLKFAANLLKSFPTIRRIFRQDIYISKTGDGYDAYYHRAGDLYILYADFVSEAGDRTFVIFDVLKKELRSIKPDPGDPYEKIISKVSH